MSYTPWDAATQARYEALEAAVGRALVRLGDRPDDYRSPVERLDRLSSEAQQDMEDSAILMGATWSASMRAVTEPGKPLDPIRGLNQRVLDMALEIDKLNELAAALATTLEGVLNSACHPDIAIRTVMVPLAPVREALAQYQRFVKPPTP